MGLLLVGILFLLCAMMLVMGLPFVYYLKHDREWATAKDKTPGLWYS
jgi:hypothetical protein